MSTYLKRSRVTWVMLFLSLLVTACTTQSTPEQRTSATTDTTPISVQTPTRANVTITEEDLEKNLSEVLLGDLKDVIFDYKDEPGTLFICWDIKGAFSTEIIAQGAQEDTVKILRAVVENNVAYDQVHVSGWYPMTVDINNTIKDTEVISLYYDRETLEGRSWDTIRTQYIWWIADRGFVNKELQR